MKKTISLLVAGSVIAMLMSGCGEKKETMTEEVASAGGPLGKYEKTVTFNVAAPLGTDVKFVNGEDIENNVWADLYQEKLGIDLNYLWTVPENQYDQKISLAIASKDLPDMFPVKLKECYKLAEAGLIEDMTEVFDEYASELVKDFAKKNETKMKLATKDGKLMCIPMLGEEPAANTTVIYIRKDWLDALNMPVPQTMEEYLKAITAFAKEDPDGNGVDDTFGLSISKEIYNNGLNDLRGFFNSFGSYPGIWVAEDNKLVYGSIQSETKEALQILQNLYKEGIIDKEFVVKDRFKVGDDVKAGKFGSFYGVGWAASWACDNMKADEKANWISVPVLNYKGKEAKIQTAHEAGDALVYVVKKGVKNKEALVKMLNLSVEMTYGESFNEETYNKYEFATVGEEKIMVSKYKFISGTDTDTQPQHWENCSEAFANNLENETDPRIIIDVKNAMEYKNEGKKENMSAFYLWVSENSPFKVINSYLDKDKVIYDMFTSFNTDTMITKKTLLEQKEIETFTKIITGDNVELFDQFATEWKNLGGEEITKEVNDWYEESLK